MTTRQLIKNKLQAPMYNMGGYKSRYNIGGIRRRQTGGMYGDNTVQSVGQGGGPLNTSSIVYQESNPDLQAQRIKGLEAEEARLRQASIEASGNLEQMQEQGEITADQEALAAQQQSDQAYGQVKSGLATTAQAAAGAGLIEPGAGSTVGGAFSGAKDAYTLTRSANTAKDITQAGIAGVKGTKLAMDAAKAGGQVMSSAATGKTIIVDGAGNIIKGGSALGSGLGAFATSGAGLGLIGAGLGYGVDKLWGDDDPTTTNFAEGTSGVLGGAGTGASIGSMIFPGPGTAIGAGIGALVGLGSKLFGSRKAKRAKRKAEREHKRKVRKIVTKHNKELDESFSSQRSRVRSGELKQKTYSGYDMGRNVVAQMGGMRMGTPRYGYKD